MGKTIDKKKQPKLLNNRNRAKEYKGGGKVSKKWVVSLRSVKSEKAERIEHDR